MIMPLLVSAKKLALHVEGMKPEDCSKLSVDICS